MRAKARTLGAKLCTAASTYKGVLPNECQKCESPCEYGMELLKVLGMEKPERKPRISDVFEPVKGTHDRNIRKVMRELNRG